MSYAVNRLTFSLPLCFLASLTRALAACSACIRSKLGGSVSGIPPSPSSICVLSVMFCISGLVTPLNTGIYGEFTLSNKVIYVQGPIYNVKLGIYEEINTKVLGFLVYIYHL
jgi:hypothetical protein